MAENENENTGSENVGGSENSSSPNESTNSNSSEANQSNTGQPTPNADSASEGNSGEQDKSSETPSDPAVSSENTNTVSDASGEAENATSETSVAANIKVTFGGDSKSEVEVASGSTLDTALKAAKISARSHTFRTQSGNALAANDVLNESVTIVTAKKLTQG